MTFIGNLAEQRYVFLYVRGCVCVNYCKCFDFHFVYVRDREGHIIEEEGEGAHRKAESKREKERERSGDIHPACLPVCMMWLFAVTQ